MAAYKIELQNIVKAFPGVIANDHVSVKIEQGSIHAIIGENGAGKSTLMGVLFGLHSPDSGKIILDGKEIRFRSARDAINHGIGMVHQHFVQIPKMTVTQNIVLGMEQGNKAWLNYKVNAEAVEQLSKQYGMHISPNAKVSELSVTMQQRVEILKALYRKADTLIFDEPTAVLTPQEIEEFCETLLLLKSQGKTILFISHKLPEVMKVSDVITVMRKGQAVATVKKTDTSEKELSHMMVGRDLLTSYQREEAPTKGAQLLSVEGLSYTNAQKLNKLTNVSFTVNAGEIVGIAGVDGNGQEELVKLICGEIKPSSGSIKLKGKELTSSSVHDIKKLGLRSIFEDRQVEGLVMDFSVYENLILGRQDEESFLKSGLFLNKKRIFAFGKQMQKEFDIRCGSLGASARTLSGGNQQKIILAREISANPEIIMAVQPTRGLDVGAIEFVHQKLMDQRNKGKGVLLFSLELDEIMKLCDRIAVIYKGEIRAVLRNENLSKETVGEHMLGLDGKAEKVAEHG